MRRLCILGVTCAVVFGTGYVAMAGTTFKWSGNAVTSTWEDRNNWKPSTIFPAQVDGDDWVRIEEPVDMPVVFRDASVLDFFDSRKVAGVYIDASAQDTGALELNLVDSPELYLGQLILISGTNGQAVLDVDGGTLVTETLLLDGTAFQDVQLEISSVVTVSHRTVIKGDVNIAIDQGATFDTGEIVIRGGVSSTTKLIRIANPTPPPPVGQEYGLMHSS